MFRKIALVSMATTIMLQQAVAQEDNPLLSPDYGTIHNLPPFEKIKQEHYHHAFKMAMREQNQNIDAIVSNPQPPTFANTIEALERSGDLLTNVSTVFYNMNSANTNDDIQALAEELAPNLSAHSDNISLNPKLFARVKAVYDQRNSLNLNPEQQMLLEKTYKGFVRSGANLSAADQDKLRELNSRLSSLTLTYGNNVLKENNKFELIIDNKNDLKGLPQGLIDAAAASAAKAGKPGKWRFTLHNPSVMPFLQYADNRELRKKMYLAYTNRGNNNDELDNKMIAKELAELRARKAGLLGYSDHASYVLEESMAKSPKNVMDMLNNLWSYALPKAKEELKDMQAIMNKEGKKQKMEAWDWFYYAEKVKQERYQYMEEEMRPYLELNNVKNGILVLVKKLYKINFTPIESAPKYHEEATAYEVRDEQSNLVGIMYMDFFPRESKRGGAWMTSYREQYRKGDTRVPPVLSIVCNFTPPVGNGPSLLTPDEVETFFHEFGHALHGLLSDVTYQQLAGTSVPRDFVELPSQIMEHWAFEPKLLAEYARHYQTGEPLPESLLAKMKAASKFNQGFATVEYLAASLLDMKYHTLAPNQTINDINKFEQEAMDALGLIPQIAPRYRSTYFNHIFSGGYSSGYYSYIWSEVLDSDAFAFFKESGDIFNGDIAASFREHVLSKGGTVDPMVLYTRFRGAEPQIKYLLANRGLVEETATETKDAHRPVKSLDVKSIKR